MAIEVMMMMQEEDEDENDLDIGDFEEFGTSARSLNSSLNSSMNSSMSSVTMFTSDFLSHSGDSLSTIRTYDLHSAADYLEQQQQQQQQGDRMCSNGATIDNRPTLPGRCSSFRSVISEMSPTSISDLSPTYPRRFSDSTKHSSDTMPVLPKRDVSVCSSSYSSCNKSMVSSEQDDSQDDSCSPVKKAGSRARIVRDSIAAALGSKDPSLSLPPAFSKVALKKPLTRRSLPAIEESPNPRRNRRTPIVDASPSTLHLTRHKSLPSASSSSSRTQRTCSSTLTPSSPTSSSSSFDKQLQVPGRKQFSPGTDKDTLPKKPTAKFYSLPDSTTMEGDSGHTNDSDTTLRMSGSSSSRSSVSSRSASSADTPHGTIRTKRRKSSSSKKSKKLSSCSKESNSSSGSDSAKKDGISRRKSNKESSIMAASSSSSIPPPPPAPKIKLEAKPRRSPVTRRQSIHTHMNTPARNLPRSQQKVLKKRQSAMSARRSLIHDSLAIILEDDGEEVDVLSTTLATISTA